MSLQKQQNFLAKLYTNAELRRAFSFDSEQIGTQHDLNKSEIAEIAEIMPEELNFFAESLFWKRLREVEKFLPITQRILGEGFTNLFRQFAKNFNPQTVKKHLEDSTEFCKFLQIQNVSEIAKNAAKFEQSKLEFFGYGKRFVFCKLDFDVRKISLQANDLQNEDLPRKTKIAVWVRAGKREKYFFV